MFKAWLAATELAESAGSDSSAVRESAASNSTLHATCSA